MNSQDQTQASLTTLATQIEDLEAQIKQNLAENAEETIQCFMQEMEQEEEQNAQGTEESERQVNSLRSMIRTAYEQSAKQLGEMNRIYEQNTQTYTQLLKSAETMIN